MATPRTCTSSSWRPDTPATTDGRPQDFNDSCDPDQPVGPTTGTRVGCIAEVTVTYRYTAATPIIGNLVGTLTLEGVAQEPIERGFVSP